MKNRGENEEELISKIKKMGWNTDLKA